MTQERAAAAIKSAKRDAKLSDELQKRIEALQLEALQLKAQCKSLEAERNEIRAREEQTQEKCMKMSHDLQHSQEKNLQHSPAKEKVSS